jgi:hypothetical protein
MVLADHVNCVVQPTWLSISLMKLLILSAAASACKRKIWSSKVRTRPSCCAHAASGHAAALPSPAMNSRRRILDTSPWISEPYHSAGCKGTMVRAGADVRCTA